MRGRALRLGQAVQQAAPFCRRGGLLGKALRPRIAHWLLVERLRERDWPAYDFLEMQIVEPPCADEPAEKPNESANGD